MLAPRRRGMAVAVLVGREFVSPATSVALVGHIDRRPAASFPVAVDTAELVA